NLAANGGGIFYAGTADSLFILENTILAKNRASTGPDANNPAGIFGDDGGNLIGIAGAGSGNTGFTSDRTLGGTVAAPPDPMLGPLQYNNAPLVGWTGEQVLPTESVLSGSPAINRSVGVFGSAPVDERGFARPGAGKFFPCVGAFELEIPDNATVTANQIY